MSALPVNQVRDGRRNSSGAPPFGLDSETVLQQLRTMQECDFFRKSPRLTAFLTFTVEQTLTGSRELLKEYPIGVEVFGRPDSFDPCQDSIVRVQARRLRQKVDQYYATVGKGDPVVMCYQPGDYAPKFFQRSESSTPSANPGFRVLVAAPDRSEAMHLRHELWAHGYEVDEIVTDPASMVDRIQDSRPDLVLLDIAFVDEWNMLPECARTNSIAMINSLSPNVMNALEDLAPEAFVLRPFRPGALAATVRLTLAKQRRATPLVAADPILTSSGDAVGNSARLVA